PAPKTGLPGCHYPLAGRARMLRQCQGRGWSMAEEATIRTGLVFDERYLQHNPGLKVLPNGEAYPWVEPELHWSNHRLVQRTKQLIDLSGISAYLKLLPPRMA